MAKSLYPAGSMNNQTPVNSSKAPKGTVFGAPGKPWSVPKSPKMPKKAAPKKAPVKSIPKKQVKPVKYNISKIASKQMGRNYS